jgi:hypothetical protein
MVKKQGIYNHDMVKKQGKAVPSPGKKRKSDEKLNEDLQEDAMVYYQGDRSDVSGCQIYRRCLIALEPSYK